jgi:hypothetical protein
MIKESTENGEMAAEDSMEGVITNRNSPSPADQVFEHH